ncbi:ankyrin repeat domain-containing protein [Thermodesulfobacterium thermophilum]|uniref:ankyrin repeat domain-containing protein n=1 Tax=Thermodesulfobacterium thermophilum TaxID=886 RepID=UPI0003B2E6CE|nr:ankyrin repeat domain-containing protein [Thermodesulfobacterium thermophilum]
MKNSIDNKVWIYQVLLLTFFLLLLHSIRSFSAPADLYEKLLNSITAELKEISEDPERMKEYILKQEDLNIRDKYGDTLLHYAVRKNYKEIIRLLLEKGIDINTPNNIGETPLHQAILYARDITTISFLIQNKADCVYKDGYGKIPLYNFVFYPETLDSKIMEIFNLCVQKGFKVKENIDVETLNEFLSRGHKKVGLMLINWGVPVNEKTLEKALIKGYEDIVDILIRKGVNVLQEKSISYVCTNSDSVKLVKLLVEKGNVPTEKDLDFCVFKGRKNIALFLKETLERTQGKKIDIKKRCYLIPQVGPCKGLFWGAYFIPGLDKCEKFFYGGCDDVVPFDSVEACRNICID